MEFHNKNKFKNMKNKEINSLLNAIKGLEGEGNTKFAYALLKNEKHLNSEAEVIQKLIPEAPKDAEKYFKKESEILEKINADNTTTIAEKEAQFKKAFAGWKTKNKELTEAIEKRSAKIEEIEEMEYSGKLHKIHFDQIPGNLNKLQLETLEPIINFPNEENAA